MKHPSRRTSLIAVQEAIKQQAFLDNDIEALTAAIAEIRRLDQTPDIYTCIACGNDFPDGPHTEILAAAIIVFGAEGTKPLRLDFGIDRTLKGQAGQRLKFCQNCSQWVISPADYIQMR